jgi:DNA-directed RNA polymerase specialized sigma24 family protein
MTDQETRPISFEAFFAEAEPRLRVAAAAAFGSDVGPDAAAEALAYGWEHWDRLAAMENPAGYLYRVARSKARRLRTRPVVLPPVAVDAAPWVEPGLPAALASLSERQRVAILLVHSLGWTQSEVAGLLGISQGAVRTHLERGLRRLRSELGVSDD